MPGLGSGGPTEDATILARVMTVDTSGECRVAAIESLGDLKANDRRITEYLVAGMEHDEPAIRVASSRRLRRSPARIWASMPPRSAWKKYVDAMPAMDPRSATRRAAVPSRPAGPAGGK